MLNITGRKPKSAQYIIGGAVAVIVLFAWISIPLMHNSSLDSSVNPGNFFKTRTVNVSSLHNDLPPESGAPGYSLSGEMLNNPATSGENIASSLFQSGPEDETASEAPAAASGVSASLPGASASAYVPATPDRKGRLSSIPSITAGNSNSMTTGGAHNKFFGSGAAASRPELAPLSDQAPKKPSAADKHNAMLAMLEKTEEKSAQAAGSFNSDASRSGSSAAFEKTAKAGSQELNSGLEKGAAVSGLALGAAAQDLKRNDPQLSKKKVNLPEPKPVKDDNSDEEMKKMIIQMLISNVLGPMFGSVMGLPAVPAAK